MPEEISTPPAPVGDLQGALERRTQKNQAARQPQSSSPDPLEVVKGLLGTRNSRRVLRAAKSK